MTLERKTALDRNPQDLVFTGIRAAAIDKGIPVNQFPQWIWVFNQFGSSRGVQPAYTSDVLIAVESINPQTR